MNKLPIDKRVQIITLLVEGSSLLATTRIADVSINTVTKLLVDVGRACEKFHEETVVGVTSRKIQADEIWSFVYAKEKNKPANTEGVGDVWTWTAFDADSKLIVSWFVADRSADSANVFMNDVAARLKNKVKLTADGLHTYLEAVTDGFGSYSKKTTVSGNPDPEHISTSYAEQQNLTMRMPMRRFTRLTNAFSKKIENHCYAIALHFVYYNFVKRHKTLSVTPAMAVGLAKRFMSIEDIVNLSDDINPILIK